MPNDPLIVAENVILENRRDGLFQENWGKFIILLVVMVGSFVWLLVRTDLSREPELPNRPLTRADVPLLKKKVEFLKADANMVSTIYPQLKNKVELQIVDNALAEVVFSPKLYPAVVQLKNIELARFAEARPDLVEGMRTARAYEDARFDIANNPAVTEKAAAIAALDKRFRAAKSSPQYAHYAKGYHAARNELIGDPEFDRADQACRKCLHDLILKHHPELGEFVREEESRDAAYHAFMAQANALSRKIVALESGTEPVSTAVAVAALGGPTHSPTTLAAAPTPVEAAERYRVNVGDTVEISAVKPIIALHRATITGMDNDQVTVRSGDDVFTVRWQDLIRLNAANRK